jgi:hypothetical protein
MGLVSAVGVSFEIVLTMTFSVTPDSSADVILEKASPSSSN